MAVEKTLQDLLNVSREISTVATIAEKARIRLLKVTVAVAALAVLLLAGVLWVALENQRTANTIESCITPEGECFKQSQARTGTVVQRILDGQIANTECRDEADVRACVEAKLAP
jgi:hypothetical protein